VARPDFKWVESASVAGNARRVLPPLAEAYFQAGRALTASKATLAALHRFRLASKRFRYTLEIFGPCYGPGLETRLAGVRKIQQHLGDINDCAATGDLLRQQLPRRAPLLARMERFLRGRTVQKVARFNAFWRGTFDKPGELERWTNYLARHTLRRPRAAAATPGMSRSASEPSRGGGGTRRRRAGT
jgi:hypothetical protein